MEVEAVILILMAAAAVRHVQRRRPRPRRYWMRHWLLRRETMNKGLLNDIEREMMVEDAEYYKRFMRMTVDQFNMILDFIMDDIVKENTVMRASISPRMRLAITLRYLATGESFSSLGLAARIDRTTIGKIVKETCQAIKTRLGPLFLKTPSTKKEWKKVAREFFVKWGFPNSLGALDGKHVGFRPLRSAGSRYYNYKKFHSIVLLILADANKKILYVDVGTNGRISDGGVFGKSKLNKAMLTNSLNFPKPKPLPGRKVKMPYVVLADNAFPLRNNLLKPYTFHGLTEGQLKFNRMVSRARVVVENVFGLLANRFRIFLAPMDHQDPKTVELLTYTCCVLHNFLMEESPETYDLQDDEIVTQLEDYEQELDPRTGKGTHVRLEFLRYCAYTKKK